jgi:pentatricopeptide repeat protein
VDHTQITGPSKQRCQAVGHRVSTRLAYLGIQDALRKRAEPSLTAGAWTGSLTHTNNNMVSMLCTQEKWDRAKAIFNELQELVYSG